jgi:hypothetical protein
MTEDEYDEQRQIYLTLRTSLECLERRRRADGLRYLRGAMAMLEEIAKREKARMAAPRTRRSKEDLLG